MRTKFLPSDDQLEETAKLAASEIIHSINNDLTSVYKSPKDRIKAEKIANLQEFKKRGGKVNKELRLSLRSFEDPKSETTKNTNINYDILEEVNFGADVKKIDKQKFRATIRENKDILRPRDVLRDPFSPKTRDPRTGNDVMATICLSVGVVVCASVGGDVGGDDIPRMDYDFVDNYDKYIYNEAKNALNRLKSFASKDKVQKLLEELYVLPLDKRDTFVKNEILSPAKLKNRGIEVPLDIIIQRSSFSDNRPTLFCMTKYLSDGKRKMTITFDGENN